MNHADWNLLIPRYIYCGYAVTPWYIKHDSFRQFISNFVFLDKIHSMAIVCINPVLDIIKSAFVKGNLPSLEEATRVLAYMARHSKCKARNKVFDELHKLLLTDEHLFYFISNYTKLLGGKKTLAHGIRRMLNNWYNEHSSLELAEMIGKQRGYCGWTHNDLLRAGHIIIDDNSDKLMVLRACSTRPSKLLKQVDNDNQSHMYGSGFKRLIEIYRLKICTPASDFATLIQSNSFSVHHVPSSLVHCHRLWHLLLPTLTYDELLYYLPLFDKMKILRKGYEFLEKYVKALARVQALKEAKANAIDIFFVKKMYRHKRLSYKKEKIDKTTEDEKKLALQNMITQYPPVPEILTQLDIALELKLSTMHKTNLRLYITMDLRKNALKRRIFSYRMVTVLEATILLACTYYLPNKGNCVLKAFSQKKDVLSAVKLEDNFAKSLAATALLLQNKTWPILTTPVATAFANGNKVDVFITISTFFMSPDIAYTELLASLVKYRRKNKCNARYILILLANHKKTQNFNGLSKPPILILTGLTQQTPKLIDAFLNEDFA